MLSGGKSKKKEKTATQQYEGFLHTTIAPLFNHTKEQIQFINSFYLYITEHNATANL